jgi:5-methylcytosine-specific restriction endonuclease McrA
MFADLDKPIVLSLNRHWRAIGWRTVRQAIVDMNGGLMGRGPAKFAMDLEFAVGADGEFDYLRPVRSIPTAWGDWLKLPIRPFDLWLQAAHQRVRVPMVLICQHYDKVPVRTVKCTPKAVYERDHGLDQYAADDRRLQPGEWNIDHVVSRHSGGKTVWENVVVTRKATNTLKGDRLPHQVGLKLRRAPKAPPTMPVIIRLRDARDPQHLPFVLPA